MKRKPPWKRNAAVPKKRIRARTEDRTPVEPIIIKSHLRRLGK